MNFNLDCIRTGKEDYSVLLDYLLEDIPNEYLEALLYVEPIPNETNMLFVFRFMYMSEHLPSELIVKIPKQNWENNLERHQYYNKIIYDICRGCKGELNLVELLATMPELFSPQAKDFINSAKEMKYYKSITRHPEGRQGFAVDFFSPYCY
jgi:hypothetical protein